MRLTLITFIALLSLSFSAFADILFLDFNGSEKEVEAAKKAAAKRGEKVIVLPKVSKEDKKAMDNNKKEYGKVQLYITKVCADPNKVSECNDAWTKSGKLQEAYNAITLKNAVNSQTLPSEIEKIKKNNTKLTSLVISGHDGNGYFSGIFGGLNESDLAQIATSNQEVFQNTRSILLWGCYTANINSINYKWRKAFPQAEIIAGFDGKAPLGIRVGSATYLEDILNQESELTKIKDKEALKKAFKKFREIRDMNAALCAGENYVTNSVALNLKEIFGMCAKVDLPKIKEIYSCYKNAEKEACKNPPRNTAQSDLRGIYNELQTYQHCFVENTDPELPSPETIIRLIFFDTVKKNMLNHNKEDLLTFDQIMDTLGAPPELHLADLDKLSRGEILSRLNKAKDFLAKFKGTNPRDFTNAYNNPLNPEADVALSKLGELQTMLGELSNAMIPFDWVEPNASVEPNFPLRISLEQVSSRRSDYERSRAYNTVSLEMAKMIKEDPGFTDYKEALKKVKQNNDVMMELGKELSSTTDTVKQSEINKRIDEERKTYLRLGEEANKLSVELKNKNLEKLRARVSVLKNEDYAHAEGKEIFNQVLDKMDLNLVYPYFDQKELE